MHMFLIHNKFHTEKCFTFKKGFNRKNVIYQNLATSLRLSNLGVSRLGMANTLLEKSLTS